MKKVMKRQITCISLCMIFPIFVVFPTSPPEAPSDVIQAAEEGLPGFLSNLPPSEMENFGFSEGDNLDEAVLGRPFLNYVILSTRVRNYKEGDSIYSVLTQSSEWYFPIMIGDETKCLLRVEKGDDGWEAVVLGYAGLAKRVALVRKVWPISEGYDPFFSINAPVYNAYFSVLQVDEYNLTQISYGSQNITEDELIQYYKDLQPLSETMKYLASETPVAPENNNEDEDSGSGGGVVGCFISTAKGGIYR